MPKTWKIWKWFPPLQKLKTVSIGYQSTVKTPQIEICWEGGSGGSLCEEVSFGPLSGYTFVPLYLESIPPGPQPDILSLYLYLWKVSPLVHSLPSLVSYHYTFISGKFPPWSTAWYPITIHTFISGKYPPWSTANWVLVNISFIPSRTSIPGSAHCHFVTFNTLHCID